MEQMYCYGCMKPKSQTPVCEHCGFDDRQQNDPHQLPMGTILQNQYIVGRVLGQGGFGITYIGWDQNLAIPVAIKEYFPRGAVQRQSTVDLGVTCYTGGATEAFISHRERFLKEARTLAQLSSVPEIVQVRNFFTSYNTAYIIMEYVQGTTLKAYLKQLGRRMTVQEVLDIMKPVLKGLSKVHGKHLIHRDISPDNIMLPTGGGVKLIDFGTVRSTDSSMMTKATESIMKPGFAPIEQYQTRGNLGTWTDVYALCATIHYCMTGKVPEDALERLENGGALPHLQAVPGMTQKVFSVLEKGLAVRIAERIQTVDEMYEMLYGESIVSTGLFTNIPNWQQPVIPPAQFQNSVRSDALAPSGKKQMLDSVHERNLEGLFAPFANVVSEQILRKCEANAHKEILLETYLNQCVVMDRISRETADVMMDHYRKNKPVPVQPEDKKKKRRSRDGSIFGGFKPDVDGSILSYCESVAHRPVLLETYIQQCVNTKRISKELADEMMQHYQTLQAAAQQPQPVQNVQENVYPVSGQKAGVFCSECGQQIPGSSKFCCFCGTGLRSTVDTYPRWYCNHCGKQIPENSKFCVSCGNKITDPVIQHYPEGHCQNCGTKLLESAKFCFSCGNPVSQVKTSKYPQGHCQSCGNKLSENARFCVFCGTPVKP